MNNEIWKPIIGYEGLYEVSNFGRVRNRVKALSLLKDSSGYLQIQLSKNNKPSGKKVHRLVLEAFIGSPSTPKHQCNHKNGNKQDNRLENLEWVSPKENMVHAWKTGLNRMTPEQIEKNRQAHIGLKSSGITKQKLSRATRGCNNPSAILNELQVRCIRRARDMGCRGIFLAQIFGVKPTTISMVFTRKCWNNV